MSTCTFCGSVNPPDASRCTLCDQVLVNETSSNKGDQATGFRVSRYGENSNSDQSRPPPGWGTEPIETPPPGWGTADSSSWGGRAPVARRDYGDRKKKQKRRSSATGIIGVFRLALILIVIGVLLFLGVKFQLGGSSLNIALLTASETAVTGTFEVLDENETVIGSTEIDDAGSMCRGGRFSNFKVKIKDAQQYYFRYNGDVAGPIDNSAIKAANYNVTINETAKGLIATVDRPRSCL